MFVVVPCHATVAQTVAIMQDAAHRNWLQRSASPGACSDRAVDGARGECARLPRHKISLWRCKGSTADSCPPKKTRAEFLNPARNNNENCSNMAPAPLSCQSPILVTSTASAHCKPGWRFVPGRKQSYAIRRLQRRHERLQMGSWTSLTPPRQLFRSRIRLGRKLSAVPLLFNFDGVGLAGRIRLT